MSTFHLTCPGCGADFTATEEDLGCEAECSICGQKFTVAFPTEKIPTGKFKPVLPPPLAPAPASFATPETQRLAVLEKLLREQTASASGQRTAILVAMLLADVFLFGTCISSCSTDARLERVGQAASKIFTP